MPLDTMVSVRIRSHRNCVKTTRLYALSIENMLQAFLKEKKEKKRKEAKEKKRKKRKILFVFKTNFNLNINHLFRWLKSCLRNIFRVILFLISCTYAKKTTCRKIISRSKSLLG